MRASLRSSVQIHYKSIVFSCACVKYSFCSPCCASFKDLLCVYLCLLASLPVCKSKPLTPRRCWEYSETDLHSSSSPFIHPPLPFFTISPMSDCSVVAVSLCVGEACVCILTRAEPRFPPMPSAERLLPALRILINKGISIELLLKLMETDGGCCLQV